MPSDEAEGPWLGRPCAVALHVAARHQEHRATRGIQLAQPPDVLDRNPEDAGDLSISGSGRTVSTIEIDDSGAVVSNDRFSSSDLQIAVTEQNR